VKNDLCSSSNVKETENILAACAESWHVRTDKTSSLNRFVSFADEVANAVVNVWNDVEERNLLSVDGRCRNDP